MRLQQHLTEQKDIKNLLKNNKLFQEYIKNTQYILWRATRKVIKEYEIITPRTNRKPKDTPLKLHELCDEMLYEKFGWWVRSEGVFATKNKADTFEYGYPYVFIPYEPYKFVYSPKIADFYAEIYETRHFISWKEQNIIQDYVKDGVKEEEALKILEKMLKTYTDKDIKNAILYRNEIAFKCSKYILMSQTFFEYELYGK